MEHAKILCRIEWNQTIPRKPKKLFVFFSSFLLFFSIAFFPPLLYFFHSLPFSSFLFFLFFIKISSSFLHIPSKLKIIRQRIYRWVLFEIWIATNLETRRIDWWVKKMLKSLYWLHILINLLFFIPDKNLFNLLGTKVRETLKLYDFEGKEVLINNHQDIINFNNEMKKSSHLNEYQVELDDLIRSIERVFSLRSRVPNEPGFDPKKYSIQSPIFPLPITSAGVTGVLYYKTWTSRPSGKQ